MTNQTHADWLRDAIKQVADKMLLHLEAKDRRISELIQAGSKVNGEICQTLGKALGYPTIHTGIVNGQTAVVSSDYPGAVATTDVCVGDHVAETLAAEAAQTIAALTAERDRLREAYDAGLPRWAVKYNGDLIDYPPCDDSDKDALEQLAKLWTEEKSRAYSVVPVRIVEVVE